MSRGRNFMEGHDLYDDRVTDPLEHVHANCPTCTWPSGDFIYVNPANIDFKCDRCGAKWKVTW